MPHVTATRMPVLALLLLAAGCADITPAPFGRRAQSLPNDSATVQRITGRLDVLDPLLPEDGNVWPAEEGPRPTLMNPDQPNFNPAQNTPALDRAVRERGAPPQPSIEADRIGPGAPPSAAPNPRLPPPGTTRRGSSGPPPAPLEPAPLPRLEAAPGEPATPPAPRLDGRVIPIPGSPPGITSGGTGSYQTYTTPGGGSGIAVPGGGGTSILTGPNGTTTVVPAPR